MRSGGMMHWTRWFLQVILALSSLSCRGDGSPLKVMSAPNLLRVGTAENIFVEIQDCKEQQNIDVVIKVLNHPTKIKTLATTSVILTKEKHFQALGKIMIPTTDFNKDPKIKQYVVLQANFPGQTLEKVVLVSFQSGYIFIQTDKTIYTPNSRVLYRMFGVSADMKPVEKTAETDASITIEIVTPDGIIVNTESVSLQSGIISRDYPLGEIVSPGLWKVMAKFQSNPQQSYSAEFEVKEYVLPSFEVKLTYEQPFFSVDSQEFSITITAMYLFGEEVEGTAYVVFGVMQQGHKKSFPDSLQRVLIERGVGTAKLEKKHITQTFPNINELVGSQIYVAVSVLTESGSEMVEAELRSIQIVKSPYNIRFKKTPRYFIPGMAFDVTVEVMYPDETPAQVPVVVTDSHGVAARGVTSVNGLARLSVNTQTNSRSLTITAKTNDTIARERQASATITASAYNSNSNSYIHIGVGVGEVDLGQNLKVTFSITTDKIEETHITYLILSRGQLLDYGHYKTNEKDVAHIAHITKDMLPSFRIVAYYHTENNEVVSDSVWLDVKGSCMGSLKLEPVGSSPPYEPRNSFNLKVTGDPGARVGLVAVDKGIYALNNKHRLSQKKVWDVVEKHDTGCTPGGGRDSMRVFFDAGLLFECSSPPGTPYRQDLKCPSAPSRKKRASTIMDVRTTLVSRYTDALQRECCLDGITLSPLSYNCERRSEYIIDGATCVQAFLHCCKEIESLRHDKKEETLHLARSEENDDYMDSNEISYRSNFPESWLWSEVELPTTCNQKHCETTSFTKKNIPFPDSITTWHVTGISLSRTHGICVADSLDLIVKKKFFIDLRLPYSAVRGEQVEVKAVLHNHNPTQITVRLDLIENPDLCSSASKRGRYRREVVVEKQSTRSVPFIIIPMKHGKYNIDVKASVKEVWASDGVEKSLLVVPEGILTKHQDIKELDPSKKGVGGRQSEIMKSDILLKDLVPNSPTTTLIYLNGREQISPLVENAISGQSMGSLIRQPSGCGEQNMARMTLPVIATMYLDKTTQWECVGFQKRDEALQHIKAGFTNQITYRKHEGSFAIWPYSQSSTWLTAYVAKVFAMASSLVEIQTSVICDAIKFLVLETQQPDGMFKEVGSVDDSSMIGDVKGSDSDASMTAFCLIAMQESRTLCSASVRSLPSSITKAVTYLERRLPSLTYPYAVAMTSYALANENKLNKQILYNFVSSDSSHWPVPMRRDLTLEATAYALLALVRAKAFEDARPVVRWFNQQRKVNGGYGATQATIMVYQAVAEYWATAEEPQYNLDVDILLPSELKKYNLIRQNQFTTRMAKFKGINKDVRVTATGQGEATLTMVSVYYALPKDSEDNCQNFNLTVQLLPVKLDDSENIYKVKIEVLYKDKNQDATMTILDIGLLTGFTVDKDDLNLLSKGRARTIARYEIDKALSERGSLIIYLNKVSHSQPEEISFKVYQSHKVGVIQPAAVSVYEYYNRTQCVKFYHPERRDGKLQRLCSNNECTCAEENCSMQKKENITNDERTTKACESTKTGIVEYVYKVRVDVFEEHLSTDIYTMQILEVIKEGSSDVGPQNKSRIFLGYPHCRMALDLQQGKTYLIMGTSRDIYKDEQNKSFQYVLGERTWIEYWPTEAECQTNKHRPTCLGMENLVTQYVIFGCQH